MPPSIRRSIIMIPIMITTTVESDALLTRKMTAQRRIDQYDAQCLMLWGSSESELLVQGLFLMWLGVCALPVRIEPPRCAQRAGSDSPAHPGLGTCRAAAAAAGGAVTACPPRPPIC